MLFASPFKHEHLGQDIMESVLSPKECLPVELSAFNPDYSDSLSSFHSCFPDETSVTGENEIAKDSTSSLFAVTYVCCSPDHKQAGMVTSLIATRYALRMMYLAELPDGETALVSDLKLYLWCRRFNCSIPARLNCDWESFYDQCKEMVWEIVVWQCRNARYYMEYEDVFQEVWHEIVVQLPKFAYDPSLGRLSYWLAGLTRKKINRLASSKNHCPEQCSIEMQGNDTPSPEFGPEENCLMHELHGQLEAALDELRRRTSPENYDLFTWRFLLGQSFNEIADILGMSSNEARYRYHRVKKKWRRIAKDLPFPCGGEAKPVVCGDLSREANEVF